MHFFELQFDIHLAHIIPFAAVHFSDPAMNKFQVPSLVEIMC